MPKPATDHIFLLAPAVVRRFVFALIVTASIVFLIVTVIYRKDVLHQRVLLEQESRHVLEVQQEFLIFELAAVQSDLRYMASQSLLRRFLSGDEPARDRLQREYASFATNKAIYDQIRCLDTAGQEIVRVNFRDSQAEIVPQDDLQSKATRYYFQKALSLEKGEVFVSPFDLNVEHGQIERPIKPVIRFLTPIFDNSGHRRGFLVFNYLGTQLLGHLKKISATFRGECMLVNSRGEYLQAPDPSHEWAWLLGHEHTFRDRFPDAWRQGKDLEQGQFRVGRNLFTLQPVALGHHTAGPSSGRARRGGQFNPNSLILVSHVSSAVANAHSNELLSQLMLMSTGVIVVVAVLLLFWARASEVRRYHEHRIAESESRLRQLSSALLSAQETERRNLSRDLHDELGQLVTAISLDLRCLEKKDGSKEDGEGATSRQLLRRAIEETDHLLKSLHEIATRVRPSVLDDLGLQEAVESYISEFQQRTGVKVRSDLHFHHAVIPATLGENVYRILQESLANVASHAQVDEAEVTIEAREEMLHMTVRDSGIGFKPYDQKEPARLGILGMRERVELLDGEFDLQSKPGRGTQIVVSIPLRDVKK